MGVCPVGMCGDLVCVGCEPGREERGGVCVWHGDGDEGEVLRGDAREMEKIGVEDLFFMRGSCERVQTRVGTGSVFVNGDGGGDGGEGEWVGVRYEGGG